MRIKIKVCEGMTKKTKRETLLPSLTFGVLHLRTEQNDKNLERMCKFKKKRTKLNDKDVFNRTSKLAKKRKRKLKSRKE